MASLETSSNIVIQIVNSITQIDSKEWDEVSVGFPFQEHAWYQFGETVMGDCEPVYLLARMNGRLVGRASFWIIRNEPLPQFAGPWRPFLRYILRSRPLLICRSPLSNTAGLVISKTIREPGKVVDALIGFALTEGRRRKCSFLLFDYLGTYECGLLPLSFSVMEAPEPGNVLRNEWNNFEDYLARGEGKARRHYNRTVRELEKLNVKVKAVAPEDYERQILPLVHAVERQHGAPPNPWTVGMLHHMKMANGIFLAAIMNERLVGCMLFLESGDAQISTAFGRETGLPYVYLMLFYEGVRAAMQHGVKELHWGSGAYELKRRMGFRIEDNGVMAFTPIHPFLRKLMNWFFRT